MTESPTAGTSLFKLLAREWSLEGEIEQIVFSHDDSSVLFQLLSGKLAIVTTQDAESPKVRTRIEIDTGRTTIRQRKNPVPAVRFVPVKVNPTLPVVRFGSREFMAVDVEGTSHQITARGETFTTLKSNDAAITAVCSSETGDMLAIARQSQLTIYLSEGMKILAERSLDRHIHCMAFSPTGKTLATWGEECLELIALDEPDDTGLKICDISDVTCIDWDKSERHLACASSASSFHIVNIEAGTIQKVQGYPGQVNIATFSDMGKALITSGAYRVAGWSTDDLPQNDQPGTPLTTGKAGLVIVNTIAVHPNRSLVAAGYANGLVTITSIGTSQEMMVHQENTTTVNCLTWSNKGEHLAIGFKSGKAAVVTFPDQLFK